MRFSAAACMLLLIMLQREAHAQEITGHVTSAGVPLSSTVVTLLDSSGGTIARVLSGTDGRYRMPPTTRAAVVRATRIGFRPAEARVTNAAQVLDIALERLPTLLSVVRVIEQPGCPSRRDRAHAFALWEQARAAFLATVVARETDRVSLERLLFYRVVGEKRTGVLTQVVQRDTGGSRPFGAARTARQFVELGFHDGRTGNYFAPDADVLLDQDFTRGYCLRLADRDRSRPRQAGIRFEPSARRRGRIDIDGTVWVDTAVRALTDVEFRYIGLDQTLTSLGLGGQVEFTTMPRGYPAVTRWAMRVDAPTGLVAFGLDQQPIARPGKIEVHELGGELARARWSDTAWTSALGHVSGRLMNDTIPASGVSMRLIGTPYVAHTDSLGNFSIGGLLPGRYTFSVPDAELNAIGFEVTRAQSFVSNRDAQRLDVQRPSPADFLAAKCPGSVKDTTSIMIVGRVFADGEPSAQTRVNLFAASIGGVAGGPLRKFTIGSGVPLSSVNTSQVTWQRIHHDFTGPPSMFYLAADGATGSSGAFFICKPPGSSLLRLDAMRDEAQRGTVRLVTNVPGQRVYPVRIDIP